MAEAGGSRLYFCNIGLTPLIASETVEEEEILQTTFFNVLKDFNTNPVLRLNLNSNLKTSVSKVHFRYSEGDQFVTALLSFRNLIDKENIQKLMKDDAISDFFTWYLDSVGLSSDLGIDYRKKVKIMAFELPGDDSEDAGRLQIGKGEENRTSGNSNSSSSTDVHVLHKTSEQTNKDVEVLKTGPLNVQIRRSLLRIYVPHDPSKVKYVSIICNGKCYQTTNILNSNIWTTPIKHVDEVVEFQIEMSFIITTGFFIKTFQENILQSPVIKPLKGKFIHHLVFPDLGDKSNFEKAFIEFSSYILNQGSSYTSNDSYLELEAMQSKTVLSPDVDLNVGFKSVIKGKPALQTIFKSISVGLNASNLPLMCFFLHLYQHQFPYSLTTDVMDRNIARNVVEQFQNLKTTTCIVTFRDKIGEILEDIYCIANEEKASVIGFMIWTYHFLGNEYICDLVKKIVSKKRQMMKMFFDQDRENLTRVMTTLFKEGHMNLLEILLRHLPDHCQFDDYISLANTMLDIAEENESEKHEKVLTICRNGCQQQLLRLIKKRGMKLIIENWRLVRTLNENVYTFLLQYIEKEIVECLSSTGVTGRFDDIKTDFINLIIAEPIFQTREAKISFLIKMSDVKNLKAVKDCVLVFLADNKFESIPNEDYHQVIITWLQNFLQTVTSRYGNGERVVKIYENMLALMKLSRVKQLSELHSEIDSLVFSTIDQYNIKELMRTVPKLDEQEELQQLFQNHIRKILHGKYSKKSSKEIILEICGTTELRINSRFTANIFTNIIDLFGINNDTKQLDVFEKAVDHAKFWTELFKATGNGPVLEELHAYQPCRQVIEASQYVKKMLNAGCIGLSQITRMKSKENDLLLLLSSRLLSGTDSKQKLQDSWMKCYDTFNAYMKDVDDVQEMFKSLNKRIYGGWQPIIIVQTLDFLSEIRSKVEKEEILVADIRDGACRKEIAEMAGHCRLFEIPVKSQVFWNVLQGEFRKMHEKGSTFNDNGVPSDPLDGISLPEIFNQDYQPEITITYAVTLAIDFIKDLSRESLKTYRQIWMPYIDNENTPFLEFRKTFARIKTVKEMDHEIVTCESFCCSKLSKQTKKILLSFADVNKYRKTVEAVQISSKLFKLKGDAGTYTEIVKSFHHLFDERKDEVENSEDKTFEDMANVLFRVDEIRSFVTTDVTDVLEILRNSTQLLKFLEEVLDEDIRNLIDAVEEHSEQFVRESTVSDLIEVKRFFFPILKRTYGDAFSDFFSLLSKQLKSGFVNIPAKIEDCMENLHTLKALYKNVANRGERTKEIIDSIVDRGRFLFRINSSCCEIVVKYKQDKKTISHGSTDLSDLRSRALLLMNAEEKDTTRPKTRKQKEDLERFLVLVDTAFDVEGMCLELRQTGHFHFISYERILDHKELSDYRHELRLQLEEWASNISECRQKYYYMNYIYPAQLQQLFEFLCKNESNDQEVVTILQFIDVSFTDVSSLKDHFESLKSTPDIISSLHNISATIQHRFQNHCSVEVPFPLQVKKTNITDVVQPGKPYIVGLDQGSRLVIRTMFALYMNTTNYLPQANQVLFCREETTIDELDLILRRCIQLQKQGRKTRLYCIAHVEMLQHGIQSQLVERLQSLPDGEYLLALLCCGHSHHPFLDHFADKLSHPTPLSETLLKECLRKQWSHVFVVSSDVPGLGKTETIHRKARLKSMSVLTMHISGKVEAASIIRQLHSLHIKRYNALHIDIGITSSASEIDALLFQLIILGHLSTGSTAHTLSTRHIYIEIANTVGQTLSNSLPTTTCFQRVNLEWNNYLDLRVSKEINSPIQVVCNYMKVLGEGTLDRKDIYFTGNNSVSPLTSKECIPILQKWFSTSGDMSFTMLQTFVSVLSDQLKKLSSSVFFRTSNISDMIGEGNNSTVKSHLVRAMINASHEFACRSVQSCKSLQEASMASNSNETYKKMTSAEELAKRVDGMIRWEDSNHLMILFHQNVQTVTAMYRDISKVPKDIVNLFQSQMKRTLDDFNKKPQRDLQDILLKIARQSATSFSEDELKKMSSEYALTPDNLLKMILISLRVNSSLPIIIMGETGCGKTSLVRYLADFCGIDFVLMSIHAGTEEDQIIDKVRYLNAKACCNLTKYFWLFLDEINTCDHLGLINNIVCHRSVQGITLPPNVTVIAACNPYRLRSHSTILTAGLQGKVKTDELSRLVYRVHPLPETMIDFVWDYGSLNEKDEKFYISRMVASISYKHDEINYESTLTELLAMSQHFVRVREESDCSVSLRDVDRCRKLVPWFQQFLQQKKTITTFSYGIDMKAIVLALAITYHSRFTGIQTRLEYRNRISEIVSKYQVPLTSDIVLQMIREEQSEILDRMVLPPGTAKNTALQENVFVVLVCILNRIPIFLVGKPGCSKSLSIQLIRSNLRGKDSKDKLFQTMPQLFCVSFQGSESSTSDGIIKVFEKAENYQKHNEKDVISVVILDEIGLAEVSRFNPLKVLHGLLEPAPRQNPNIAVVGISNWALDAAKMNRAVHLSRPDMDQEELKYTGLSIIKGIINSDEHDWDKDNYHIKSKLLRSVFDEIAVGYFKYVTDRQKFENFHGLRDFYSLIKYLGRCSEQLLIGQDDSDIILRGIARNFGGLPTEMGSIISVFQESFSSLSQNAVPVAKLINDNLTDSFCRHLMLITNGDSVISLLESQLNTSKRPFEIIFGSHFDDDLSDDYNYRILSRIILCMEQGLVLILKGLESIYGSLYDMLNQNYTIVGNKKNCRIALGHYSNPMCHVHDLFKCIVLVEEAKLDYSDPPFLNRFEKQQFKFLDIVEDDDLQELVVEIERTCEALCKIDGSSFTPQSEIPSYCRDLIVSLILFLKKVNQSENIDTDDFLEKALQILVWMLPPEVIIRAKECKLYTENAGLVDELTETFFELPLHSGLAICLDAIITELNNEATNVVCQTTIKPKCGLVLCYTYTNIHDNAKSCFEGNSHQCERLSSFKSEKQFSNTVEDFFVSEKSVLLIQCSATHDNQHLLLCKVIIENIRRKILDSHKHICIVVHLDRNIGCEQQYVPINFLSGWKIIFLDSIEKPKTEVFHFTECSRYEIVKERIPLITYIKDNFFWALTRIKFTSKNNSIENQTHLIDEIRNNETVLSTIEMLTLKWVEEQTTEGNSLWCVHVAKNSHELYRSGSLVCALENSITDVIKTPIAVILFRLLELQIMSPVFVNDEYSQNRIRIWKEIVLSDEFTLIQDVPPVTGPACYTCCASFNALRMPLSVLFMDKINAQKDEFLEVIRKLRIHNDIDEEDDIPNDLLLKAVTECIDIVCPELDDIHKFMYEGIREDFLHDFCNVNASEFFDSQDEVQSTEFFKWALMQLLPPLHDLIDMVQYMAVIHATLWVNRSAISYTCNLLEQSEKIFKVSLTSKNNDLVTEEVDTIEDLCIENMRINNFVDCICLKLLQTRKLSKIFFVEDWLRTTNSIVPVAKQVYYEANYLPALQILQDLMDLVGSETKFDLETMHLLCDSFQKTEGQINYQETYQLVIDILRELSIGNTTSKLSIQKVYCSYILRCLQSHPDDDSILSATLEMIANDNCFDVNLAYFGKVVAFAVMLDNAEDDNLMLQIILDETTEHPPFIACFDYHLRSVDQFSSSAGVLQKILVDVIETSCLETLFPTGIFNQIDSASHDLIKCLMKSHDIVQKGEIAFRFIASVAFIKKFLFLISQHIDNVEHDKDDLAIINQHMYVLFSGCIKNPYLTYFLKILSNHVGIIRIDRYYEKFKTVFPTTEAIEWNSDYRETSLTMNPLYLYCTKSEQDTLLVMIDNILDKDNSLLDDYLNASHDKEHIVLLAVLIRKFFMRRAVTELNDNESRVASELGKRITQSKLPNNLKQISMFLLGEQEFRHEQFALSEESGDLDLQMTSLLVHLCCLTVSFAEKSSAWTINLLNPCKTSQYIFPCATSDKKSVASCLIMKFLNSLILVGALGFNFASDDYIKCCCGPESNSFLKDELVKLLEAAKEMFMMNFHDTCDLLHCIIFRCKKLILTESDLSQIGSIELERRFTEVIECVIVDRWYVIHDTKKEWCRMFGMSGCLEADIEEISDESSTQLCDKTIDNLPSYISDESNKNSSFENNDNSSDGGSENLLEENNETSSDERSKTYFLSCLLRRTNASTKESLITELNLCERQKFPFLHFVFDNMKQLILPRFIYPLLKWQLSVVANASYKFRRVDFNDLSVQKYFSQEPDGSRRNLLKKHFEHFKKSWNEIRDSFVGIVSEDIIDNMEPMTTIVKMENCMISTNDSLLSKLLKELVDIHNNFLNQATVLISKHGLGDEFKHHHPIPLLDLQQPCIVAFTWKDNWLNFSQCDSTLGRQIHYDFEKIEQEVQNDMLFGKLKIEFPKFFPCPIYIDDLYHNSVQLLVEIQSEIPQQNLTTEIRRSVQMKMDRDTAFVTELLSYLGMAISLLKKTGGDSSQPFIEYLEKWQNFTGMTSTLLKRILPEPIDTVRLGHVVNLYQWLEELNGTTLVDTLDEVYRKPIPTEARDLLQRAKKSHMPYLEKMQHPLMVFVHRCLSLQKNSFELSHALIDYIKFSDLWWKEDFHKEEIIVGKDKKTLALSEILSPLLAIEHVYETVVFLHDAIKEAREFDVRITLISTDFQKQKTTQPRTRRTAARKVMKI